MAEWSGRSREQKMSKFKLPEGYELIDGNKVVDQIKADRNKTEKNSGIITQNGKILASAKGSKPIEGTNLQKLSPKQKLLKRIEIYNDLIDQTDSDRDKIIPGRDYDFDQFKEGDYISELDRINTALKDAKLEDVNGDGVELEGGMPSYEAVKDMSDEEYAAYEKKYLDGPITDQGKDKILMEEPKLISELTPAERKKIGRKVLNATLENAPEGTKISGDGSLILSDGSTLARTGHGRGRNAQYDFIPPEGYEVIPEPAKKLSSEEKRSIVEEERKIRQEEAKGRFDAYQERLAEDSNDTSDTVVNNATQLTPEQSNDTQPEPEYEFTLPKAWEVIKGTHPGIQNAVDAVKSVGMVIDQGQPVDALQDAARGLAGGLVDTTGNILDIGGLLKNRVANEAHKSARWWEDQFEIPNSEAGRVGSKIGTEAVTGLLGGVVGKVAGNVYKGLKLGGETLRRDATRLASDRQNFADDTIDYSHKFLNKIGYPASIRPNKISYKDAPIVRQNTYENITSQLPRKPLSGGEPLTAVLAHNIKRNFDNRAMLQKSDREIEDLFSQGVSLDNALRIQQERWNRIPDTVRDAGMILGIAAGE